MLPELNNLEFLLLLLTLWSVWYLETRRQEICEDRHEEETLTGIDEQNDPGDEDDLPAEHPRGVVADPVAGIEHEARTGIAPTGAHASQAGGLVVARGQLALAPGQIRIEGRPARSRVRIGPRRCRS